MRLRGAVVLWKGPLATGKLVPVELLLDLRRAGGPLRRRLEEELRDAVRAGRLPPGTALPSTPRARRAAPRVARGGGRGLRAARRRGLPERPPGRVDRRGGTGAGRDGGAAAGRAGRARAALRLPRRRARPVGVPARRVDRGGRPRAARPARRAARVRRRRGRRPSCAPSSPRTSGAARGVVATPDRVLVTGGTRQALALVWRALAETGVRRVAVEDPCWAPQRSTVLDAGLEAVPVPVDERRPARGPARPAARRRRRAHARRTSTRAAPCSPPSAAPRCSSGRAITTAWSSRTTTTRSTASTASRSARSRASRPTASSTRARPARRWRPRCGSAGSCCRRRSRGCARAPPRGAALLDQLALAGLMASGELDRHLRRTRRIYRRRRDALRRRRGRRAPGRRGAAASRPGCTPWSRSRRAPTRRPPCARPGDAASRWKGLGDFHHGARAAPPRARDGLREPAGGRRSPAESPSSPRRWEPPGRGLGSTTPWRPAIRRSASAERRPSCGRARATTAPGVQELARVTKLGKGALYHHIGSKEQLLYEISLRSVSDLVVGAEEVLAMDAPVPERLRLLSRAADAQDLRRPRRVEGVLPRGGHAHGRQPPHGDGVPRALRGHVGAAPARRA